MLGPANSCVTPPLEAYDDVKAKELVIAVEEETAKDADIILFEPNGPYTLEAVTKEAVAAVVATGAQEALTAHDEVPNKEPVTLIVQFPDALVPSVHATSL